MRVVDSTQDDPFAEFGPGRLAATVARSAMGSGHAVSFMYDDKFRVVEVHAIGTSTKDGSLVMRAMQVAGQASRPLPQWTLFTLAKIEGMAIDVTVSEAPREGYAQGDRQMSLILSEMAL